MNYSIEYLATTLDHLGHLSCRNIKLLRLHKCEDLLFLLLMILIILVYSIVVILLINCEIIFQNFYKPDTATTPPYE